MKARARRLSIDHFSPVLIDLCACPYLRDDAGGLCALVDTYSYMFGPREMDFVLLEYGLERETARHFIRGYEALLPLPRLGDARLPYRYLFYLMQVNGAGDYKEWMGRKALFQ